MRFAVVVVVVAAVSLLGCRRPAPAAAPAPAPVVKAGPILDADQRRVFKPLPAHYGGFSDARILLGRTLFHDPRLSSGQDVSCNSCHALATFGVDGKATSPGTHGKQGRRNSPTVFNAAGHFAQFWDGRAKNVEEQAGGPMLNPIEMGMSEADVVDVLRSIPGYLSLFTKAFPNDKVSVTWANTQNAIGAFERQLATPSRYDAWAKGDDNALTDDEQRGALTFMATGCLGCHNGPLFGGGQFQKAGAVQPWFSQADHGRKEVTGNVDDDFVFKVPSLRNVEKTGPWFHDGSVNDLGKAVRLMAKHQLGRELADDDAKSIVTFLKTLTGTPNVMLLPKPVLPPSGPRTPAPR
ncbi:MAG: cytochrome c peroxidase [Deltaproteobacteria bacterium]|nr:cytochrome c peroxidase [Deltaproteobacteria bacterium]